MSDEFDLTDPDTASARPGAPDAAPLRGQLGELVERAVGARLAAEAEAIAQAQFEEMLTPELHTALADAVRRALTAVTTPEAEPGERGSVGEVGPYYPNAYRFFTEFLAPAYRRKTVDYPAMRWCPSWFCHPEARARVDALWRAWEYLRLDPATGMSVWWKDHADHHMAKLLSPDGAFKDCTPQPPAGAPAPEHRHPHRAADARRRPPRCRTALTTTSPRSERLRMSDEHQTLSRDTGMVLRTSLQVAMQVAEALARRREQNLRVAAAASDARARSLAARLAAERRSTEAFLQRATDRRWWATATEDQIVDVVRVAHTWKDTSPVADRAATSIEERLRLDKGVELPELRDTVATGAVAAAVERELADRARHEIVLDETGPDGVAVDRDGAATPSEEPAVPLNRLEWDTPQRRAHTASTLTAAGIDGEAIDAHLLTDTANAAALDAASMRSPSAAPAATSGERSTDVDRSIDRGGR